MSNFLDAKLGRAAAACIMTLLVLRALYLGETGGRFSFKHEESETGFGISIVLQALLAAGLWLSVLF